MITLLINVRQMTIWSPHESPEFDCSLNYWALCCQIFVEEEAFPCGNG